MIDNRTAPYAALLLRITLGFFAIAHLYWKFELIGIDTWWGNLDKAGYPDWVITYVISGEFAGALLLIPGIFTRWVSLYALPLMLGAVVFWLQRKGFFFTGSGAEFPILWSIGLFVQAGLGDGAFALVPSPNFPFLGRAHGRIAQA
jgi:putative oxidoreductase